MIKENVEPLIVRYIDGELKDQIKSDEIKNLIERDKKINFEYKVQLVCKSIASERLKIKPVPAGIKNKVIRKINPSKKFLFFLRMLF